MLMQIQTDPSGRAKCFQCTETIKKGTKRLAFQSNSNYPAYLCTKCTRKAVKELNKGMEK